MVYKVGKLYEQFRGHIGGGVHVTSASGGVIRSMKCTDRRLIITQGIPGSSTAIQGQGQKAITASVAQAWRQQSHATQAAWNTLAVTYPFTNKFGVTYTGSGYQLFMQWNARLAALQHPLNLTALHPSTHTPSASISFVHCTTADVEISYGGDGSAASIYAIKLRPYIPQSRKPDVEAWRIITPYYPLNTAVIDLTNWLIEHYGQMQGNMVMYVQLLCLDKCGYLWQTVNLNSIITPV